MARVSPLYIHFLVPILAPAGIAPATPTILPGRRIDVPTSKVIIPHLRIPRQAAYSLSVNTLLCCFVFRLMAFGMSCLVFCPKTPKKLTHRAKIPDGRVIDASTYYKGKMGRFTTSICQFGVNSSAWAVGLWAA